MSFFSKSVSNANKVYAESPTIAKLIENKRFGTISQSEVIDYLTLHSGIEVGKKTGRNKTLDKIAESLDGKYTFTRHYGNNQEIFLFFKETVYEPDMQAKLDKLIQIDGIKLYVVCNYDYHSIADMVLTNEKFEKKYNFKFPINLYELFSHLEVNWDASNKNGIMKGSNKYIIIGDYKSDHGKRKDFYNYFKGFIYGYQDKIKLKTLDDKYIYECDLIDHSISGDPVLEIKYKNVGFIIAIKRKNTSGKKVSQTAAAAITEHVPALMLTHSRFNKPAATAEYIMENLIDVFVKGENESEYRNSPIFLNPTDYDKFKKHVEECAIDDELFSIKVKNGIGFYRFILKEINDKGYKLLEVFVGNTVAKTKRGIDSSHRGDLYVKYKVNFPQGLFRVFYVGYSLKSIDKVGESTKEANLNLKTLFDKIYPPNGYEHLISNWTFDPLIKAISYVYGELNRDNDLERIREIIKPMTSSHIEKKYIPELAVEVAKKPNGNKIGDEYYNIAQKETIDWLIDLFNNKMDGKAKMNLSIFLINNVLRYQSTVPTIVLKALGERVFWFDKTEQQRSDILSAVSYKLIKSGTSKQEVMLKLYSGKEKYLGEYIFQVRSKYGKFKDFPNFAFIWMSGSWSWSN